MRRETKTQERPLTFLRVYLAQDFRRGGLRSVFELLVSLPLILVVLGALLFTGWDWKFLVILPLTIFGSSLLGEAVAHYSQTFQVFKEIEDLYHKYGNRRFTPLTTDEYLEALYQHSPESAKNGEEEFARSMLSGAEYFVGNQLRFIVIDKGKGAGISNIITYATFRRSWIFLDTHPTNMRGLKHFTVLHEIGHTDLFGMMGYGVKTSSNLLLFSLPLILLMVSWNITTAIILASLLLVFYWARRTTIQYLHKHMRFYDELYADIFAFDRCPRHWFQNFSPQDIEEISTALCQNSPTNEAQNNSRVKFDAPLTDEQVEWRRRTFSNNIKRVLEGKHPVTDETIPLSPVNRSKRLRFFQVLLMTALLIALGTQYSELTTGRFVWLVIIMILVIIAGLAFNQTVEAITNYWDIQFGFKKELHWSKQSNLDGYMQLRAFLAHFKELRAGRISPEQFKAAMEEHRVDKNFSPPGVTATLFSPDEVDLFAKTATSEAFIFHGKVIDYNISHLE